MEGKELKLERYMPERKRKKYPCITIRENAISFNAPCFPAFHSKNYIEFFYDRQSRIIVIRPYHRETPYTTKIAGDREKGILMAGCRGFLTKYNLLNYLKLYPLTETKSKRFRAVWDEKKQWFLIDLNDGQV